MIRCHGIYGTTQLAKYLPGNIFHLAGRHARGLELGIGNRSLAGATVVEIISLVASAVTIAFAGAVLGGMDSFLIGSWRVSIKEVIITTAPLGLLLILFYLFKPVFMRTFFRTSEMQSLRSERTAQAWIRALLLHIVFLGGSAGIFLIIVYLVHEGINSSLAATIIVVFCGSWISGYLTPGAPGGIGIREAFIVMGLATSIGESESLQVALLYRLVSMVGDGVFFLWGLLLIEVANQGRKTDRL